MKLIISNFTVSFYLFNIIKAKIYNCMKYMWIRSQMSVCPFEVDTEDSYKPPGIDDKDSNVGYLIKKINYTTETI